MSNFLKDILTYVASNLAQAVREDTINGCTDIDNDTYTYLKRVNDILVDIESNGKSIYHVICANDAKPLLINAIVHGYPLLRRMTPSEKSSFINSISMNINAFFVEYEASKQIPKGPVEDDNTETEDSNTTTDPAEDTNPDTSEEETKGDSASTTDETIPTT